MALTFRALTRPNAGSEVRAPSRHRTIGLSLAAVGLAFAAVSLVNSLVAGDLARQGASADEVGSLGAWSFGLTTAAFGTVKLAIGLILLGIVRHIWVRVESVKAALPALIRSRTTDAAALGAFDSDFGPATATATAPKQLLIHRLAGLMWAPMLAMGVMLVYAGLLLSFAAAGNVAVDPALASSQQAWVQGVQFLGEGLLLSGISFLLGTILGSLRKGGGEVQESLGVGVRTLDMPLTAKLFVGLMALGLMVEVFQFVAYAVVATFDDAGTIASSFAWLGPVREAGLGVLLSGIVLALATIGKALGFQFSRIVEIVSTGS